MRLTLVTAVNALTTRWLAAMGADAGAASGLGVWPLLAFLAEPAASPGRAELAAALGTDAATAIDDAREVLETIGRCEAARLATAVWTPEFVELRPDWVAQLPKGTRGTIVGRPEVDGPMLDAWVSEHTSGRIDRFPVEIDDDVRLLLASALFVATEWIYPFSSEFARINAGPWRGDAYLLERTDMDLDILQVVETPHGPFTDMTLMGTGDVDVHLVLAGEMVSPVDVLACGVDAIATSGIKGSDLALGNPGPGVEVARIRAEDPGDRLRVTTVPFDIEAEHDLLEHAEVFGLRTVMDSHRGHFPGISTRELCINGAAQRILARFTATGFEAAAVTAVMGVDSLATPGPTYEITEITVRFDRPFAFYSVDRNSGLILAAGWVAEPDDDAAR